MSFADDVPENARDFSKLPQVDMMCALLINSSRTGIKVSPRTLFIAYDTQSLTTQSALQVHSIRESILTAFISLAMAHDDALTILSESPFFIPSLVALLADLSTALWEEHPELMASPDLLSECVSLLSLASVI
jgi:hypothetical protein